MVPYVNAFESAPSPIGFASSAAFRGPPRWVESSCARPTDKLDSVAWTVQEVLLLTRATLPRFPKLVSVPGVPAALPGKKICAYSAHTRFRVESTLRILYAYSFSTYESFNKRAPTRMWVRPCEAWTRAFRVSRILDLHAGHGVNSPAGPAVLDYGNQLKLLPWGYRRDTLGIPVEY